MCTSSEKIPIANVGGFSHSCVRLFPNTAPHTAYLDLRPMGTLRAGADHGWVIRQQ